jgi:hypothetical protein
MKRFWNGFFLVPWVALLYGALGIIIHGAFEADLEDVLAFVFTGWFLLSIFYAICHMEHSP